MSQAAINALVVGQAYRDQFERVEQWVSFALRGDLPPRIFLDDEPTRRELDTDLGRELVRRWRTAHRVAILQVLACTPTAFDYTQDELSTLTRQARVLMNDLSKRVAVAIIDWRREAKDPNRFVPSLAWAGQYVTE